MADRYWVGGSGTWNTTSTTNWSTQSGGSGGASVPTVSDSVFFDQASTYTVTMTGALACLDFNVTGGTVTFQDGTTPSLNVRGSWSTVAATVWNTTGTITFSATTSRTITSNGITIRSPLRFNGTGGTWTLQDNLSVIPTVLVTLTAGTLALSTYTLTAGVFSSSGSTARTLNFGTGKIVLNGTSATTVWNTGTVTSLTISGTPLVECIGGGTGVTKTINTGALSIANSISFSLLSTTGTSIYAFTASNVVRNLTINGVQTVSNIAITIYGNYSYSNTNGTTTFTAGTNAWTFGATSGTQTITSGDRTYDFPWTINGTGGTFQLQDSLKLGATRRLTLTNGTFDFNNQTFTGAGVTIATGTPTIANTGGPGSLSLTVPITHTSGTLTLPFNLTTTSASGYTFTAGTLALGSNTLTTTVFSSSNSNSRILNFGTGKIVLNGTATATVWNTTTVTNLTVSGTPLIECQGGGTGVTKSINTGALSEANSVSISLLETTGTVTYSILGNLRNLLINGSQTVANTSFWIYGNFTHLTTNGTTTFTAGTNAWIFTATSGTRTLEFIDGFTYDFPWTFGSAASTARWTLPSNLTLGATRQLTLTNGTFDFNSFTVSAAGITIATGTPTIANTGSASLTTALPITHTSGTLTLPFAVTTTAAAGYTFTAGTLTLNNQTLTTPVFSSNNATARTLAFGVSGQIALTGNGVTIFDTADNRNLTITGTLYVNCTYTGSVGTRSILWGSSQGGALATAQNVSFSGTTGIVLSPSATDILALSGGFNSINFTGFTGTLSNTTRTIYGSLTIPAGGGTYTAGTNVTTFAATSAANITTNGVTLDFPITFNGVAGNWTLQDNLTVGSTRTTTLTNGTITLNNLILSTGTFSSSGSTARTIAFGTGQINLTGNNLTIFDITTATNFTTTGTVFINCTYAGSTGTRTIVTGFTEAQSVSYTVATTGTTGIVLNPSATDTLALTGSFNNVDLTGFIGTLSNTARTLYGILVIPTTGTYTGGTAVTTFAATSGTETITTNGKTLDFPITINGAGATFQLLDSLTLGATRLFTLTAGTLNMTDLILTAQNFSSSGSTARIINFGTTGQISLVGNNVTLVDFTTMTNFTYTGTPKIYSTYNGATGTRVFNFGGTAGATATNILDVSIGTTGDGLVIAAGTDSITLTGNYNNVTLTGLTNTVTNSFTVIWGNLDIPASGGTFTAGTSNWTFVSPTTQTITTNGRTLDFPFTIGNGTSKGNVLLGGALTLGSTRAVNLTSGNFNLNDFTTTASSLTSTGNNVRQLQFANSGQFSLVGSNATIISMPNMNNFNFSGNARINSTYTGATGTRTFDFGSTSGAYPQNVFDVNITGTSGLIVGNTATDSIALTGVYNNIDLTGITNTLTNTVRKNYGNLTVPAAGGTFTAGASIHTMSAPLNPPVTDGYSVSFDGTGDYLSLPTNSIFALGTGDFEISFWMMRQVTQSAPPDLFLFDFRTTSVEVAPILYVNSLTAQIAYYVNGSIRIQSSTRPLNNIWYNITLSRVSGVTRLFIDGVQEGGNYTDTDNYLGASAVPKIAARFDGTLPLTGWISNFIINKGSGVSSVTLPTAPYSLTANTILFTCDNNNFTDSSTNNFTITINGNPSISLKSPFSPSTAATKTLTTNGRTLDFPFTFGDIWNGDGVNQLAGNLTLGSSRALTVTSGNFDLNDFGVIANTFTSNTLANRTLSFDSIGNITLVGSNTTIINMAIMAGFQYSGTPKIISNYTGATGTRTFAIGNSTGATVNNTFNFSKNGSNGIIVTGGTDTLAMGAQSFLLDLDLRNATNIISNDQKIVSGNFYVSPTGGTFTAGTSPITLTGQAVAGNCFIDTQGRALDFPVTLSNGNYVFSNNYICGTSTTASTRTFIVSRGNLYFNDNITLTANKMEINGIQVRGLNFIGNTGQINLVGSNTQIWNSNSAANLTISGNYIINSRYTSNVGTRVFDFGPFSEANALSVKIATGTQGFNIGTANDSVTLTGNIGSLDLTGLLATVTNTTRTVFGNLTIPATGGAFTAGANTTTFAGTTGIETIDTSGRTLQFPLIFDGVGGNYVLANNLVANATTILTLTNGQVDFNQKSLTFANIRILTGNTGLSNLNTALNFVHTSGNLTPLPGAINSATSGTYTMAAGLLSTNAAPFTTGAFTLTAGNVSANAPLTTGAFTHTAGNMSVLVGGSVNTAAYTQNGGNIIINGGDLTVTTLTSNNSTTRSIQLANGNINVTGTGTVVNMATTANLTANGTGNIQVTSIGSTAITVTPGAMAQANTINYNFTGGTYALTLTAGNVDNLNFTGFAGTLGDSAVTIFGNLTISSGMTRTAGTGTYTFASTANQYITSNGKLFDFPITINGVGGNVILNDALTVGSSRTVTLNNGTFDMNGVSLSAGAFTVGTGTKTLNFNSANLTLTGSGWTMSNSTGFTLNKGSSNVSISMTSSSAKTFAGGGISYDITLDQNGSGNLSITGNNTFEQLAASYATIGNCNFLLPNAGLTTVANGLANGIDTTKLVGYFSSGNARSNLRYNQNGNILLNFISTANMVYLANTASLTSDGTTPWKFYVGANSLNNGNVLGAIFQDNDGNTAPIVYVIQTGTSWTVPSDWNSSNNQIHLWGAGGGGGQAGQDDTGKWWGGAGGGGGGYTQVANFSAAPLSTVNFAIGVGGNGGGQFPWGNNGTSTTFSTYSANGGNGATNVDINITPYGNIPGTGGVGGTYNGGNGGNTLLSSGSTYSVSGGGGGGSGGPFGNGGNGGNGTRYTLSISVGNTVGGGGGGGSGGGSDGNAGSLYGGGNGGHNYFGIGGGISDGGGNAANVRPPFLGGGAVAGAGNGSATAGTQSSFSADVLNTFGGAGGGAGCSAQSNAANNKGSNTFLFGVGGGGGAVNSSGTGPSANTRGSAGSNGGIMIVYYTGSSPVFDSTSKMFLTF